MRILFLVIITTIVGFEISNNKLIFDLSQTPSNNAKLSFIGFSSNIDANITNGSGIELVSFSDFCISGNCNNPTGILSGREQTVWGSFH